MSNHPLNGTRATLGGLPLLGAAMALLALLIPFEWVDPLFLIGPLNITSVEFVAGLSLLPWLIHGVAALLQGQGRAGLAVLWRGSRRLLAAALPLLAAALLSAALAPLQRRSALIFALRLAGGLYVALAARAVAAERTGMRWLLWALVLGAGASALLGLGEAVEWPPLMALLAPFKVAPTRVGGTLRVSATFQYATIAAMYFEMALPLALALAASERAPLGRALALLCALFAAAATVLTLTRSGMATLALLCLGALGLALLSARARPLLRPAALTLATLLAVVGVMALQVGSFRTRLLTENDTTWYNARYRVPSALTLTPGSPKVVSVTVENLGRATWTPGGENGFALGYHWLSEDGRSALAVPDGFVGLPRPIAPGERVVLEFPIQSELPPGRYRLAWGMLQHHILWFRHRDVPEGVSLVTVVGRADEPAASAPPPPLRPAEGPPPLPPTVGRRDLWRAALAMWQERPLLGVGPDNYRHLYGQYLGLAAWDIRIYANNLYLELLATLGLLGLLSAGALLLALLLPLLRALHHAPPAPPFFWGWGIAGALLALLAHGFLDYFLGSNAIHLMLWLLLGMADGAGELLDA